MTFDPWADILADPSVQTPWGAMAMASLDRGIADIAAGRVTPWSEVRADMTEQNTIVLDPDPDDELDEGTIAEDGEPTVEDDDGEPDGDVVSADPEAFA